MKKNGLSLKDQNQPNTKNSLKNKNRLKFENTKSDSVHISENRIGLRLKKTSKEKKLNLPNST